MTKFSFKIKLLGLCGFLAAVSIVITIIAFRGLRSVGESYSAIADTAMPNLNLVNDMYLNYRAVRINLRSLGLPGLSKKQAENYISNVHEAIESYEKADKEYNDVPFQPGEKEIYDRVNAAWGRFKEVGKRALAYYAENSSESKEKLIQIFLNDCPEAAKEYTAAVVALKSFHIERAKFFSETAKKTEANTNQVVLLVAVLGILSGGIVAYIFATTISRSISNVAQQLASNAVQVSEASSQIASSSQELSEASTEQASSLEETAASLEEITSMITKATENAHSAAETSGESHKKAEEGRGAVDQMLNSMEEISQSNEAILTQVNESNRQMTEIVKVIQDIGNRTKVINEIVFQTKLLSFNASVEAARAGEHGKGFAVVAEEVGNLAQMSGNAAKEITDMLGTSIAKVEGIVRDTQSKVEGLIKSGKEKVDSGVTVAKQCSEVLNEIVQNVSRVSGLSQEISQASKEQALGVTEINKAMAQLDTVTQKNATTSEEAASSSKQLAAQAVSLKASVDELMYVISGKSSSAEISSSVFQGDKPSQKNKPKKKSNVVHLRPSQKLESAIEINKVPSLRKASGGGDSFVPHRDDEGFSNK